MCLDEDCISFSFLSGQTCTRSTELFNGIATNAVIVNPIPEKHNCGKSVIFFFHYHYCTTVFTHFMVFFYLFKPKCHPFSAVMFNSDRNTAH